MTKPYPGPYFLSNEDASICTRDGETGEIIKLCMFTEWGERDQATARAIVSKLDLLAALREIAKGQGPYSRDPFQHACNTIEDMKELASAAIAKAEGRS